MSEANDPLSVLLVTDRSALATHIVHASAGSIVADHIGETTVTRVCSLDAAANTLTAQSYDVCILDLCLGARTGVETVQRALERDIRIPLIVVPPRGLPETGLAAIQRGATTYIHTLNPGGTALARALRSAVETGRQTAEIERQAERFDRLMHVVSHDLRDPLNVAQLHLEPMRVGGPSGPIAEVAESLDRAEEVIQDVVAVSRYSSAPSETESVSLGPLAVAAWRRVDSQAAVLEIDTNRILECDPTSLQHLFETIFRDVVERSKRAEASDESSETAIGTVKIGGSSDGFFVETSGADGIVADRRGASESGGSIDPSGPNLGMDVVSEVAATHGWETDFVGGPAGGLRYVFEVGA